MVIKDEKLGVEIAESSDEKFWLETKEKCLEAMSAERRNLLINDEILKLCEEQLSRIKDL
jgi:hypothetical protein